MHLDALYSFALKLARARDEAEDLVSDTCCAPSSGGSSTASARTSARGCSRSSITCSSAASGASTRAKCRSRTTGPGCSARDAVGDADPEGTFYDSFLDDEIVRAIDALPDEYRTTVVLSDIQELRYAEIAEILGIPGGTVKSRLFRGRRLLQRQLRGYAEEMGYVKSLALAS